MPLPSDSSPIPERLTVPARSDEVGLGGRRAVRWGWAARPATEMLPGHRLGLLTGGHDLCAALVQAMDAARSVIHLETYIFEFEGAPLTVAHALERAARRGVTVRLVVDGIGTGELPVEWRHRFAQAGVKWRVYVPLGRFGLLIPSRWRRLHRKLCVVDGVLGFCGGINLLDDHLDPNLGPLQFPRFDFAVRCAGPLVQDMADTMLQLWWRMQAVRKVRQREFAAAWQALKAGQAVGDFAQWWQTARWSASAGHVHTQSTHQAPPPLVDNAQGRLVLRDNIWHRADIERAYLQAIAAAQHEVLLANAYFVPGKRILRALEQAVKRGVTVRVLLQGQYEGFMQYHAARPVYARLIQAGVDVRAYTPSALHAKVAVVDGQWATVGSSNLDPLSLLLAREANVVTTDVRFAQDLRQRLHQALEHGASALDGASLFQRPLSQRLLDRVAFGLMRAVLFLTGHRY